MEISFSQMPSFICSKCNTTFEAQVWLIVDTVARPDLLTHILNGTLNELICPNCGQTLGQIDAPLLLYSSNRTPTLYFSPAQQTTADQNVEQAKHLLRTLHKYLGSNWNDTWLEQGLRIIPYSLLPIIFSHDAKAIFYMTHDSQGVDTYSPEQLEIEADPHVPLEFRDDFRQALEAENRYEQDGDLAALDVKIAALENLLNKPNLVQYSLYASVLSYAESAYLCRYDIVKRMEDLERAIQILNNGVKHIPTDSPLLSSIYNTLGSDLKMRYNRQGQIEDLELAIINHQKAVDYIIDDSFGSLSLYQINLGKDLFTRYEQLKQLEDLEAAIKICQIAVKATPSDSSDFADNLNSLGGLLLAYYDHHKKLEDLNQAILILQTAVERATDNSPDVSTYFTNLGTGFYTRYNCLGHLGDLDQAIVATQRALKSGPNNSPDRLSTLFTNLGDRLRLRYECSWQLEDLEDEIEAYQEAVKYIHSTSSKLPAILNNLSLALIISYQRLGKLEDLDQAIVIAQRALEYGSDDSPKMLSTILSNLGVGFDIRYEHLGHLEDLENAIKAHQEAVTYTDYASSTTFTNLGCSLRNLYEHSGRLENLESATEAFQKAVLLKPTGVALSNLGVCLHLRYKHTGKLENLERAIEVLQQALDITPKDSLDLPTILDGLGLCLSASYRRTGKLEVLEQAITMHQEAVKQASINSLTMSGRFFSNLGLALLTRYSNRKQLEDLEQALKVHQEAVDHTPDSSPELSEFLNTLGMGFYDRYQSLRKLEDLKLALATTQRSIKLAPINSPHLPNYFNNLGNILHALYTRSERLEDLDQVITVYQKAVDLAPDDFLGLPSLLANLGSSLRLRYKHTKEQEDMHRGMALYESACQKGLQIDIKAVLESAHNWINWAIERKNWAEAIRAYRYGSQAIEQLYRTQILRNNQEFWLSEARDMYIKAAYAMAHLGQLSEAALTLEQSRARGLNEALARDRADLERIQNEDQETYRLYQQITERLRQIERVEREESAFTLRETTSFASPSFFDQIQEAREELAQVITHIRQIHGYEDFLAEPTYHNITSAVRSDVPLVYLATTSAGSFALLINAAQSVPEVIWINDFVREDLISLLLKNDEQSYLRGQLSNREGLKKALTGILYHQGKRLVHPIANRLEKLGAKGVVLIPMELLSPLPLHAVCYNSSDKEIYLLDKFDVAYAPSARVLARALHEEQKRHQHMTQFVGVGNPLPDIEVGVWAQSELQRIIPLLQQKVSPHLSHMQVVSEAPALLSPEEYSQLRLLLPLWEQILQHLRVLCQEQPERMLQAGHSLQRAHSLFLQFKEVLADLSSADYLEAALASLAKRIPPNLTYAHAELESIETFFPANAHIVYYEHTATRDVIWSALSQSTIAHFACHGIFDTQIPLGSALMLANETRLTLRDLLNAEPQQLTDLCLVVLSACQTAVTDLRHAPDEIVGLLSGFLQAAIPSVVGTLWAVDDLSTALLLIRFYELYLFGDRQVSLPKQSPAQALRLAQCWLRDLTYNNLFTYLKERSVSGHLSPKLTVELLPSVRKALRKGQGDECPYADAYYWAGFVYYGVL